MINKRNSHQIETFVKGNIKNINKSIRQASKVLNSDYKEYLKLRNSFDASKITEKEYLEAISKINYFFNEADLRSYLFTKSFKALSDDKIKKKILKKFKKFSFVKARIEDIANNEYLYKKDLEKFFIKESHEELVKKINLKKLEEEFLLSVINNADFDKNKFDKLIKSNIKKLFPYFAYHLLKNGFPINIQGLNTGIMFANAGDSGEHFFVARAILAGFNASVVDVRSSAYDVIIDINGKLLRVQIKSFENGNFSRRGRPRGGQGIDSSDPTNQSVLVTSNDCDIFATIIKSTGTVYMFVGNDIDKLPEDNFKAEDFSENLENWDDINNLIN